MAPSPQANADSARLRALARGGGRAESWTQRGRARGAAARSSDATAAAVRELAASERQTAMVIRYSPTLQGSANQGDATPCVSAGLGRFSSVSVPAFASRGAPRASVHADVHRRRREHAALL